MPSWWTAGEERERRVGGQGRGGLEDRGYWLQNIVELRRAKSNTHTHALMCEYQADALFIL